MYKPPENSNRVKLIKSKFEDITSVNSTKPPLLRSKTVQTLFVANGSNDPSLKLKDACGSDNNGTNTTNHTVLARQLSDPSKRNIKRTPAFRLDRNIIDQKATFLHLKNNLKDLSHKSNGSTTNYKERLSRTKINSCGQNNFSDIRSRFSGENLESIMHHLDVTKNETENNILKLLYAEAIPKSKRTNNSQNDNIHNLSTLKICDKRQHLSDDESCYAKTNFVKNNFAYGSLRSRKSLENLNEICETGLTDTLKSALQKPLPLGPAPKKPPRTFVNSPKIDSNISKQFTDKLNAELQKNVTKKTNKGDAKYMLDKLETALKKKGKLLRKAINSGSGLAATSEEDSDNEKNKFKYRILPNVPEKPIYYSTPPIENSSKFNFNCLSGSLGCISSSTYEAVKEPTSSFFVNRKTEEPVYAEPFQYQVEVKRRVKNKECKKSKDDVEEVADGTNVRRSVHYASSPVPDVKLGDTNGQVSDAKHIDQQILTDMERTSPSFSTSSSEMESIASTQSETFISYVKVKERVQAFEANDSDKKVLLNNNSNTSAIFINESNTVHDSRLKSLAMQLKTTLDQSFSTSESNSPNSDVYKDDDNENKLQTSKFVTYVNKVRSKLQYRLRKKKENLFHCCLLVALNRNAPYIKSKYPPNVDVPYKIEELCFPEVECGPMDYSVKAQCYSLIITNELGKRTFGYCRRVLPEGSTACLPLVYCILSKHRAPGFYRKILEELENCHGYPDKFRDLLLEELYNCKFPMPGETIAINCSKVVSNSVCHKPQESESITLNSTNDINCDTNNRLSDSDKTNKKSESSVEEDNDLDLKSFVVVCNHGEYGSLIRKNLDPRAATNGVRGSSAILTSDIPLPESKRILKRSNSSPSLTSDLEDLPSELVFIRPQDSRHEENALATLGETLKVPILQKVFCSLLLERKVIFVSCVLSKLSSCIEALQIILYPFSWQHTIIPVLPTSLWEIVEAPTPLVCGVLSAEVVNNYNIEDALIVDLDEGTVLLQVGDEDKILPASLIHTLKDGLNLANKVTTSQRGAHNIFLSDAFLRVFIQSCGHYKNFIVDGEFKKAEFIQHSKPRGKHVRQFLKWFTETTMFFFFKELAETDSNNLDLFDQRIKIYSSDSATEILNKMKYWTNYRSMLSSNLRRFQ